MIFNGKCWRLQPGVLAAAMTFLTGCGAVGSDVPLNACPPVVKYSRAEQTRIAQEVAALPEGAIIPEWLADYAVLREQARACAR
jgi:hypothetical protein